MSLDEGLSNPRNSSQKRNQISAHLRPSFSIVEKTVGEAAGGRLCNKQII